MTVTIWHNPRCSKSRQTLELLKSSGVEPAVREYLKAPPSKAEVEKLVAMV
ncbi:MAG: arsenate reductase (glutaredoxin), partial [Rhodospirillales bacterium 35-66-84]